MKSGHERRIRIRRRQPMDQYRDLANIYDASERKRCAQYQQQALHHRQLLFLRFDLSVASRLPTSHSRTKEKNVSAAALSSHGE
jgi:hypothetical protein